MNQLHDSPFGERLVLVVDDEPATVEVLQRYLQDDGLRVVHAADGWRALSMVREARPDIVLLDINLPQLSGLEVLRAIRVDSDIPVIMLTSRGQEIDRIVGLEIGADDYIGKPFSAREVVARVRAVLRRRPLNDHGPPAERDIVRVGPIEIDRSGYEVRRRGVVVDLTPTEFRVLNTLADHIDCALTRAQILHHAAPNGDVHDRTLDRHVANLRRKIEDVRARPVLIVTVAGIGYKLVDPANAPSV
jgi:two-component system response regulator AdeR